MAEIVKAAKSKNLDIVAVVYEYRTIKLERLNPPLADMFLNTGRQAALVAGMLAGLFFVSLMIMLLAILAIERNTRPPSKE